MKPAVAAFDFDGTLTVRDTIVPFLVSVSGSLTFAARLPQALPSLGAYGLGFLDPTRTKEALFRTYLRGRHVADVEAAAIRFAHERVPRLLRPSAMRRLLWHQARGHRCFVVTASPELYVAPWASTMGIETLGSRLEVDENDFLTGSHHGPACTGPEKVRRLCERVDGETCELYAYGDSAGDKELLAAATHAYWRTLPEENSSEEDYIR